jgi:hypothetical protein
MHGENVRAQLAKGWLHGENVHSLPRVDAPELTAKHGLDRVCAIFFGGVLCKS